MSTFDELRNLADRSVDLSDEKLVKVLELVAEIPDKDQAQAIISRVRPRLVKIRPPRKPTIQRLFFNPVEDLFVSNEVAEGSRCNLSRGIIAHCWTLVTERCDPKLLPWVNDCLRRLTERRKAERITALAPLWQAAAEILKASSEGQSPGLAGNSRFQRTGAEANFKEQLSELSVLFSIAQDIENAKLNLPEKPIVALSENDLVMIRAIMGRLAKASPEKMRCFVMAMAARMSTPGEMLKAISDAELPLTSKEAGAAFKGMAEDALSTLSTGAKALKLLVAKGHGPAEISVEAKKLTKALLSLRKNAGQHFDRSAAEALNTTLKELGQAVASGVASKARSSISESLRAELDQLPNAEDVDQAKLIELLEATEGFALTLQRCAFIADATGVSGDINKYMEDSLLDIKGMASPVQDKKAQSERLFRSLRLTELVYGPERAYHLYSSLTTEANA